MYWRRPRNRARGGSALGGSMKNGNSSNTVQLSFMGQKVVLKSEGDPELIQEAVDLATLRLADAETRIKGVAPHHVALLALLDIAEEYVRSKRRSVEHKRKLEKRTTELMGLLDQELK